MASPLLKFALVGRRSSGKTCLLTAMGMPNDASQLKIFCNLSKNKELYDQSVNQPDIQDFFQMKLEKEGNESLYEEDEQITSFETMQEKAEKSIVDLATGRLPNATLLTSRSAYLYNFSTNNHVQFDAAIFDYAGELVSKSDSQTQNLLKFFSNMNGLICVAEVCESDKNEDIEKHAMELKDTMDFFKSISNDGTDKSRFNIPIALIITKIDKFTKIDVKEYAQNNEAYLNNLLTKYYSTKQGSIIKALAEQIKSVAEIGCFKVFPVSAIGNYDGEKIKLPLESIGILEPFGWLATTYAEILSKQLEQDFESKNLVKMLSCHNVRRLSDKICKLAPDDSELYEKARLFRYKANKYVTYTTIILIAILSLLWFTGEFVVDYNKLFKLNNTKYELDNVDKSLSIIDNLITDYGYYADSNAFRHILANVLVYSKKNAIQKRNELITLKENLLSKTEWNKRMTSIESDIDKLEKGLFSDYSNEVFWNNLSDNINTCSKKYVESYQQSERLKNITERYKPYADKYKENAIHTKFELVFTKLNKLSPISWKEGLDESYKLKNDPIISMVQWQYLAKDSINQYLKNYDNLIASAKQDYIDKHDKDLLLNSIIEIEKGCTNSLKEIWKESGRDNDDLENYFQGNINELWFMHISYLWNNLSDKSKNPNFESEKEFIAKKSELSKEAEKLSLIISSSPLQYLNDELLKYIQRLKQIDKYRVNIKLHAAEIHWAYSGHTVICQVKRIIGCNTEDIISYEIADNQSPSNQITQITDNSRYNYILESVPYDSTEYYFMAYFYEKKFTLYDGNTDKYKYSGEELINIAKSNNSCITLTRGKEEEEKVLLKLSIEKVFSKIVLQPCPRKSEKTDKTEER